MTSKNDFSTEDWTKIVRAPLLAGFAVTAADPSGFVGLLQEAFANAKGLAEAKSGVRGGALAQAVAEELLTAGGIAQARDSVREIVKGAGLPEIKARSLRALTETAALLNAKSPGEYAEFKDWLHHIAKTVADAGTEGGFLGFGGEKLSPAEKATLDELSEALSV